MRPIALFWATTVLAVLASSASARTWVVAPSGGDYTSVQAALDVAVAGDLILVRYKSGGYREKIEFPRSGNPVDGFIEVRAWPGETPALDGTDISGQHMVFIKDRSWLKLDGLEIRNLVQANDGSGIRIEGGGSHLQIRNCSIHDIGGRHAMGITVYGTSTTTSLRELVIDGNEIFDCEPYPSEALTLNGNVERFEVTNNYVHDVTNIGIDFIAGETDINPLYGVRDGHCRGNRVERAREQGTGGYAAGIYVDGAQDIVIEDNHVSECDLGIEIGAENRGTDATGIVVRDNVVFRNDKVGLIFGGYSRNVGRVRQCLFAGNTCFENDTVGEGVGEVWIQWASDNELRGNIFCSTTQNILLYSEKGNENNQLDYNLWHTPGSAETFVWRGVEYPSFEAYRSGTGQDEQSLVADPGFTDPAASDFSLLVTSPAIDRGLPGDRAGSQDVAGNPRVLDGDLDGELRVDLGAHEFDHIHLSWSGRSAPGDTITVSLRGTPGFATVMFVGAAASEWQLSHYGALFIDLADVWSALMWSGVPSDTFAQIPDHIAPGSRFHLQVLGILDNAGTLSNPVVIEVEPGG